MSRQRGSASLEAVLLVPVLLLLLGVTLALGRVVEARHDADDAAREAARAASLTRSAGEAGAAASAAATSRLAVDGRTCREPRIETETSAFRPGGTVAVTITCTVDLVGASLPATTQVSSRSRQPLEPYRGFR